MPSINKQMIFNKVPKGFPVPGEDIKLVETEIDLDTVPLHGGFLSHSLALDLSPYMRGRMRAPEAESYNQPFALGKPMGTLGVSKVIRSDTDDFKKGDLVYGFHSLQEYNVFPQAAIAPSGLRVFVNEFNLPITQFVGAVGMPGLTAFYSYSTIGKPKKGETIYVSAGSGAVGQIVCQLAKADGLKVVASAGSDEKVAFLKELGVDVAFNYKSEKVQEVLKANPIDIFFDNVGGEQLEAALDHINAYGRIICCGSISGYNVAPSERYPIRNLFHVVAKQLTMQGFIITGKDSTEFYATMPRLVAEGKIIAKEHVVKGLDNGESFLDLLHGHAFGKVVISLE